jgi:hypothetical protein
VKRSTRWPPSSAKTRRGPEERSGAYPTKRNKALWHSARNRRLMPLLFPQMDDPQRYDWSIPRTGVRHPTLDGWKTDLQGNQGTQLPGSARIPGQAALTPSTRPMQSKFGYQCVSGISCLAWCACSRSRRRLRLTQFQPPPPLSASSWSRTANRQRPVRNTVSYACHVSP